MLEREKVACTWHGGSGTRLQELKMQKWKVQEQNYRGVKNTEMDNT